MSSTTHTRPPGSGFRQDEPREGEEPQLPSLGSWEAPVPPSAPGEEEPLPVLLLTQQALSAATHTERAALATRINFHLDALSAEDGSRQVADLLHELLESGQLAGLVDGTGRSCRAAATEALTRLGFPFALEVRPEDLAHLRGLDEGFQGFQWVPAAAGGVLGAGILAQGWVLFEEGAFSGAQTLPLCVLMGLSLMTLVLGVLGPERSASRRAGLISLAMLSLVQLFLSVFWGYQGTVSGVAGLVACLLLLLPRR